MSKVAKIKKPIRRRIGNLVVEIGPNGIRLRGFRRRKWHAASWEQIAALDDDNDPQLTLGRTIDRQAGAKRLQCMQANPTERKG